MTILQGLFVIGLLQLVAVPTLTTPLPQDRDEFADQLTALEDALQKLPSDELQQLGSDVDVDALIQGLMDLSDEIKYSSLEEVDDEAVADAIDELKVLENDDDLRDELLDEVNDEVEDELDNLSDIAKVLPTVFPDDVDELIEDLINLGGSNKTTPMSHDSTTESSQITYGYAGSNSSTITDDDLVNDLMDLETVEEIVSEVVTELLPNTEPVTAVDGNDGTSYNPATSVSPADLDLDVDYELVTELTMVTEVVYNDISEEITLVDGVELSSLTATDTLIEDLQPTSTNTSPQQNEADLAEESTTIQNIENQPEATEVVTEIITELETEPGLLITELVGGTEGEDDGTEMTQTDFPEDEDLEMELWDLKAATDEMVDDDDEPTFVFTTPYPSTFGSSETLDLIGPDLHAVTVQSGLSCPEDRFACADGSQCVLQDTVCDIMFDCTDGSDESPDVCHFDRECPSGFTKCSRSPQCIEDKDWCDGVYHCYNGADEKNCMSCIGRNGDVKELLIEDFCDGVQDCDDNYDEVSERCNHPCPLGSAKCADGLQCIKDDLFCNGFKNCHDRSDEGKDCARSMEECERFEMFSCDGICMIKSALCDGMPDCRDKVDEKECSDDIFSCPEGFTRSKKDHVCVHRTVLSKDQ